MFNIILRALLGAILVASNLVVYAQTTPQLLRTDPNLITPLCYGAFSCSPVNWVFSGGARLDCATSHSSGCSVVVTKPGDYVISHLISVTPNQVYTFSYFTKTNSFPQAILRVIVQLYKVDSNGYSKWDENVVERHSVTKVNGWQEVTMIFQPKPWQSSVAFKLEIDRQVSDVNAPVSSFWISDLYMGKSITFNQPPSAKVPFDGSRVKVDGLGNFSIRNATTGLFASSFPICVYADMNRPGWHTSSDWWSTYSRQGFNCNMWAGFPNAVQRGKDNGMMSGYDISGFSTPAAQNYKNSTLLASDISSMKVSGLIDSLLYYYWDNENAELYEWATPASMAQTIKANDIDISGHRMHPIYQLQGETGLSRKYNAIGFVSGSNVNGVPALSDVVGTYVHQDPRNSSITTTSFTGSTKGWGLTLLGNLQAQTQPVSFAQFGSPQYSGNNFVAAAYVAIAKGARGIGYWKDCVSAANTCTNVNGTPIKPIDQNLWWKDLPALAAAINSQLELIRTPHWTTWALTKTSTNDNVEFGTRTLNGKAYIIAGNESPGNASPTFSISGLAYAPSYVINAVTKDAIASVSNGSFTLPIRMNDGGFYILGDAVPDSLALDLEFNGNLTDLSTANNSKGALIGDGISARIENNALVLNGGYAKIAALANSPIPAPVSLEMSNNLSIVAKIKMDATQSGYAGIVTKGASSPNVAGYAFFYDASTNRLNFWYGAGGVAGDRNYLSANVPPLQGQWHTVAVSANLSGVVVFYVDGIPYPTTGSVHLESSNSVLNPGQPLLIGSWVGGNLLRGAIDFVRIYKAALPAQSIPLVSN